MQNGTGFAQPNVVPGLFLQPIVTHLIDVFSIEFQRPLTRMYRGPKTIIPETRPAYAVSRDPSWAKGSRRNKFTFRCRPEGASSLIQSLLPVFTRIRGVSSSLTLYRLFTRALEHVHIRLSSSVQTGPKPPAWSTSVLTTRKGSDCNV
jgi:hypothetical protein